MNEARPYASLSSGLLARKGTAKPAMRPQGFAGFDDLGWNDMGNYAPAEDWSGEPGEHVPSSIAALTPAPRGRPADPVEPDEAGPGAETSDVAETEVAAQQQAVIERFGAEPAESETAPPAKRRTAKVVALPRRAAGTTGRKAAFTLRLDADRHLRLRLATTVLGRSAQQIVTAALDDMLATIPEIEALASRLPAAGAKRN